MEYKVTSIPLSEGQGQGRGPGFGPDDNVPTRPRNYQWRPTEPASLVWVEAIREGNENRESSSNQNSQNAQGGNNRRAPSRDRLLVLKAPFQGTPVEYTRFTAMLPEVDILIASSGAPHYILRKEEMQRVISARRNKPMFLIDIAVPRNIEPSINDLDNVFLYDNRPAGSFDVDLAEPPPIDHGAIVV